jgi:glycerol-3-phosphate dehydrogenase
VVYPGDFLLRRTGDLLFDPKSAEQNRAFILQECERELQWDEETKKDRLAHFEIERQAVMQLAP